VSAGGYHTCGITNTGSVECWGYDNYGQSTPPDGTYTETVSAGADHTYGCATARSSGWALGLLALMAVWVHRLD